jgi:MerR family copper efflux transcriptional regulator
MQIGTVARKSGVPAKTIRYYESVGLIDQAGRSAAGYRVYGVRDVETLRFISRVKHLASDHLGQIDRKIAELRAVRATLVDLIERCHGDERPDCPILADLATPASEAV